MEKLELFEAEFRTKLAENPRVAPLQVVIVGAGAAGIEMSFNIQKRFGELCDKGIEVLNWSVIVVTLD